jgi:hypothetical protein
MGTIVFYLKVGLLFLDISIRNEEIITKVMNRVIIILL